LEARQYEVTFILPPALAEDEITSLQDMVQGWITDQKGEIQKLSHWGRRRLAYPVQNYKEGYYILLQILADPAAMNDLDRRMRLDTTIMRHLIVRMDE